MLDSIRKLITVICFKATKSVESHENLHEILFKQY